MKLSVVWGRIVRYEYLVIATGAKHAPPAKTLQHHKERAMRRVALVGGGAVGVQLACDVKTVHLDGKKVVLTHS